MHWHFGNFDGSAVGATPVPSVLADLAAPGAAAEPEFAPSSLLKQWVPGILRLTETSAPSRHPPGPPPEAMAGCHSS